MLQNFPPPDQTHSLQKTGQRVAFTVPPTKLYGMAVIDQTE